MASAIGIALSCMRCTCSSAKITGPTKKMNSTRPGESKVVRRRSPWRGGMRNTNSIASNPNGMLIQKIDCQPNA